MINKFCFENEELFKKLGYRVAQARNNQETGDETQEDKYINQGYEEERHTSD